jgi:hypothetical protein
LYSSVGLGRILFWEYAFMPQMEYGNSKLDISRCRIRKIARDSAAVFCRQT